MAKVTNRDHTTGTLRCCQGVRMYSSACPLRRLLSCRDGLHHGKGPDGIRYGKSGCLKSWPEDAKKNGAAVVGTGRSDYPNQINNVLAFPGIFRGALDVQRKRHQRGDEAGSG